jgi:hypothetical protein
MPTILTLVTHEEHAALKQEVAELKAMLEVYVRNQERQFTHEAEIEQRTYHIGTKPTLGKNYDDRLTVRLGCSPTTAYTYLGLPEHRGGIRHRRLGKKYHVTERAIREWEGDSTK